MTNEQIKEVLDAFDEDKQLQYLTSDGEWTDSSVGIKARLLQNISFDAEYRVKPKPKKIELYAIFQYNKILQSSIRTKEDTHKLSYLVEENGEPICDSIKLEKL